jgi:sulfite exporter TauE/SafE/copper chaperone CopZ/LysM repeat protein
MTVGTVTFRAHGMHCHGCEHVIEATLRKIAGVSGARASYPAETVRVDYDPAATDFSVIRASVEEKGYRVDSVDGAATPLFKRIAIAVAALLCLAALILADARWIGAAGAPDVSQHLSLELIFALGLVTGFHCIGMCGGFVMSYAAAAAQGGRASLPAHLAFAAGKTLSYTTLGALFGAVGALVAFTPLLRGAAGVAAGLFLIVFGLNMLGLFAPLRRYRLDLPAPLRRWVAHEARGRHQPFVIGLLNGLMLACGPLQAMYVTAAGTGSPVEGAKMLFAFGLGTLPVMLSFGAVASALSNAATHRLLRASGVIVVALGAVMINRGLILTGSGADLGAMVEKLRPAKETLAPPSPSAGFQTIEMEANRFGYSPARFTLVKGKPVKWRINASEITVCNRRILVPALDLQIDLKPGWQTIDITPTQSGVIAWSCWMGMLRGSFEVIEETRAPAKDAAPAPPASPGAQTRAASAPQPAPSQGGEKQAPATRKTYVVQRGDTLARIAARDYGDARRWRDIAAANPGLRTKTLTPGQLLNLPAHP